VFYGSPCPKCLSRSASNPSRQNIFVMFTELLGPKVSAVLTELDPLMRS
jgi:hypothetical protein